MKDAYSHKVVINADSDLLWYIYESNKGSAKNFEAALKEYVKGYANQGVSDLMFCCFAQMSVYPSKSWDWFGNKYYQQIENGIEVNYTKLHRIKHIVDIYHETTRDPYEILLDETRKNDMIPWISIRMNDCHFNHCATSWMHGDIYYQALNKGWTIGEEVAGRHYAEAFNYAIDEIRNKMLDYICETLDRYDMDGLELDFQREFHCFNYIKDPDCYKIMTDFMQKIRVYANSKEKERGHRIKIGVRLCRNIEDNKVFGFDIVEWIKQGLIDVVVPTSRWENTDSDIPIAKWRELLRGTEIKLWAGLETLLFCPYKNTEETIKGFVVQYLEAGADQIYLYNFFRTRAYQKSLSLEELATAKVDEEYTWEMVSDNQEEFLQKCWHICADINLARKDVRRHVMTFQEDSMVPRGASRFKPFPAQVEGEKYFTMQTGKCYGQKGILYIGVEDDRLPSEIAVDDSLALYLGEAEDCYMNYPVMQCCGANWMTGYVITQGAKYHAYEFIAGNGHERVISVKGKCGLRYLEIKLCTS